MRIPRGSATRSSDTIHSRAAQALFTRTLCARASVDVVSRTIVVTVFSVVRASDGVPESVVYWISIKIAHVCN